MKLIDLLEKIRRAVVGFVRGDSDALEYITTGEGLPHPLGAEEEAEELKNLKTDPSVKTLLI